MSGVEHGAAMARTACPTCGHAATLWLWIEQAVLELGSSPRRVTVTGLLTDLVHDLPTGCVG